MVKVLVKKLNSRVKLPEYKTSGSSGMDLMAFVEKPIKISLNNVELIQTGLFIEIQDDEEKQDRARVCNLLATKIQQWWRKILLKRQEEY